jgi:glycosyltransferase involved in cell wall biosynthesis
MKIQVLTVAYNEEDLLPYFLRHYGMFCDSILVYDNCSTDRTAAIAAADPKCKVFRFDTGDRFIEEVQVGIRNNGWKIDRDYDWQIVVDVDELLYHPHLFDELELYRRWGVSVVGTIGYDMIADSFPYAHLPENAGRSLIEIMPTGKRSRGIGKNCIFNPRLIEDINYSLGSHKCAPTGEVVLSFPAICLLHYRYFGFRHYRQKLAAFCERLGGAGERLDGEFVERYNAERGVLQKIHLRGIANGQYIARYHDTDSEEKYLDRMQLRDPVNILEHLHQVYRSI